MEKFSAFVIMILCFVSSGIATPTLEELKSKFEEMSNEIKSLKTQLENSQTSSSLSCGNWTQYKDEKCINVLPVSSPLVMYDDALKMCSEKFNGSMLLTIHSEEETKFLNDLIFKQKKIMDNVWIGAEMSKVSSKFEWKDGSEFKYQNWQNGYPKNESNNLCVQLKSDDDMGKWTNVQCTKRNAVVCQRVSEHEISNLGELQKTVHFLRENPIPIGFIYTQLSGQSEPKTIWPMVEWEDVSHKYAGLFFRVNGGNSSEFGNIQEEDSPRLSNVVWSSVASAGGKITVPHNGDMSGKILSGPDTNNRNGQFYALSFGLSKTEVRPRNLQMKIWRRAK